jgi:hypothetical protein
VLLGQGWRCHLPQRNLSAISLRRHHALLLFLAELQHLIDTKAMNDKLEVLPGHALVFCGDLLDRGPFSIEVFALVLLLRKINSDSVFVGRGNHETSSMWENYGLEKELKLKYGEQGLKLKYGTGKATINALNAISVACSTLHVALFLSVEGDTDAAKWALAVHGGFEPSGSVKAFLAKALPKDEKSKKTKTIYAAFGAPDGPTTFARRTWHKKYFSTEKSRLSDDDLTGVYNWKTYKKDTLMYLWADIDMEDKLAFWNELTCLIGRCLLSKRLIMLWMTQNNVVTMFRGHQHNGVAFTNINK